MTEARIHEIEDLLAHYEPTKVPAPGFHARHERTVNLLHICAELLHEVKKSKGVGDTVDGELVKPRQLGNGNEKG